MNIVTRHSPSKTIDDCLFWIATFYLAVNATRGSDRYRKRSLNISHLQLLHHHHHLVSHRFVSMSHPNWLANSAELNCPIFKLLYIYIYIYMYSKIKYFISQGPRCDVISLHHIFGLVWFDFFFFNGVSSFVGYLMPKPFSLKNSSGTI